MGEEIGERGSGTHSKQFSVIFPIVVIFVSMFFICKFIGKIKIFDIKYQKNSVMIEI